MEQKINMFMVTNRKYLPATKMPQLRSQLENIDENKLMLLSAVEMKDPIIALVLSILFGALGVDRFMIGQVGLGLLKLFTLGGFGIWYIIDIFLIINMTKEENYKNIISALNV